jgi:arylsulfatase A-like enzyme
MGAHETFHPLNRGFHEFFGHLGGGHRYFPEDLTEKSDLEAKSEEESYHTLINRNHKPVKTNKYLTDEFSDEAAHFVERNHQKPFFLFLSYNAPHGPLQAPEEYLSRFAHIKNKKRRTYAAMVSALDDGVGRLMHKLKELKIDENTLIFFLSDNGGPETKNFSNNGVLRGKKSDPWEGGFRVPYAVRWPAQIPAGRTYDKPVSSLDIFATISSLTKSPTHADRPLDGVNLIPYLKGENQNSPHKHIYLRKFDQGVYALRKGKYKLVIPSQGATPELYNLDQDLSEKHNIATQYPEIISELQKQLDKWDSQLIEPTFLGLMSKKGNTQK